MSRNPTLSYVLCSVPPLLNCNTKESMWDLLMKYLCPRDFRRGEMEEKMKKSYLSFDVIKQKMVQKPKSTGMHHFYLSFS